MLKDLHLKNGLIKIANKRNKEKTTKKITNLSVTLPKKKKQLSTLVGGDTLHRVSLRLVIFQIKLKGTDLRWLIKLNIAEIAE